MDWLDFVVKIITLLSPPAMLFTAYYIRKLEKNTNSLKDDLVALTAKAEHAKGRLEGVASREGK